MSYATTNREGYREYKSKSYVCKSCPVRERCTQSRQCTKTVTRHVWHEYLERAEDVRHSPTDKATYTVLDDWYEFGGEDYVVQMNEYIASLAE